MVRGQTINETISGMIVDKIEYIDTDIREDVAIDSEVFLGGADVRVVSENGDVDIWVSQCCFNNTSLSMYVT